MNPDKLGSSLTWGFSPKGSLTVGETTYLGREINAGLGSFEKTRGYTVFDLSVSYSTKWGDVALGVENLLNRYYILTWGQIDQFQNYFSGRGRVVSLTHSIKF